MLRARRVTKNTPNQVLTGGSGTVMLPITNHVMATGHGWERSLEIEAGPGHCLTNRQRF
jgi:hypothetical protein